jgi:hypothetical protein
MLLNKTASALTTPPGLVILTTVLLAVRIFLAVTEREGVSPVNWLSPEQLSARKLKPDELVFYNFSDWHDSSSLMDHTAFRDKSVVEVLKNRFVPVMIKERPLDVEDADKQRSEVLQQKYDISMFPSYVVILGNGTFVDSRVGFSSARSLCNFLQGAQSKAGYRRAMKNFADKPGESANKLWSWLQTCDWNDIDAVYATAFVVIGFRNIKDEPAAQKALDLADEKIKTRCFDVWPRPILKYLAGSITKEELIRDIDFDKTSTTDARFFIAMNEQARGNLKEMNEQLEWIERNGARDAQSYIMAETIYHRMKDAKQ